MNTTSTKQHIEAAIACTKEAKQLENHIAYLRGDAFGLRLKITKLHEQAIWHLDFADAIKRNEQQYMWKII